MARSDAWLNKGESGGRSVSPGVGLRLGVVFIAGRAYPVLSFRQPLGE